MDEVQLIAPAPLVTKAWPGAPSVAGSIQVVDCVSGEGAVKARNLFEVLSLKTILAELATSLCIVRVLVTEVFPALIVPVVSTIVSPP